MSHRGWGLTNSGGLKGRWAECHSLSRGRGTSRAWVTFFEVFGSGFFGVGEVPGLVFLGVVLSWPRVFVGSQVRPLPLADSKITSGVLRAERSLHISPDVVGPWSGSEFYLMFAFEPRDGDSFGIFLQEFVGSWSWGISFSEGSSLSCSNFDFCAAFGLVSEFVGSGAGTQAIALLVTLGLADLGARHWSLGGDVVGTWAWDSDFQVFLVELLANNAPFESIQSPIADVVLAWPRALVESEVGLGFVAEAVFGTCTEGSRVSVLSGSWVLVGVG